MDIYSKNLEAFKVDNYITNKLKQENFYNDVKVELCQGQFNFIMENENGRCFVNSSYNIDREMQELFKDVEKDTNLLIIFGFGCGHILDYIDKHYGDRLMDIYIVEPNLKLFKNVLKYRCVLDSLKRFKGDFYILLDEDKQVATNTIFQKIISKRDVKVAVAYHISYRTIFKGYFEYINSSIADRIRVETINHNTVNLSKKIWIVNTIKSMIVKSVPAECLMNKLQGYPAIIVAAGPSLNKNMYLLHEIKDKAIIVAIGSSSKILDSNGIVPHLRVAIDPYQENDLIYKNIDTSVCPLVYDSNFYYNSLREYKGPKFRMILESNYIMRHVYDSVDIKYNQINSGFSVVIPTLDLLTKLKCNKIIFMGQDLSFPKKKMYAKGSWTDDDVDFQNKIYRFTKAKDVYGNEMDTLEEYLAIKFNIETIINKNPNINFINATQGGLNIEGTKIKDFQDVLKEDLIENYNLREDIKDIYTNFERNEYEKYWNQLSKSIDLLEKDVDNIININDSIYEEIKKIYDNKENKNVNMLLKNIGEIGILYNDLMNIALFKKIAFFDLYPSLKAIEIKYMYEGTDKKKRLESQKKSIMNRCVEISDYFVFMRDMLLENKQEL
ncbi:MAG: DUF115 domain-containing protein [Bacillota bacterium]|nr:DUF115 domain-containing protein [Bacillota bacterium]